MPTSGRTIEPLGEVSKWEKEGKAFLSFLRSKPQATWEELTVYRKSAKMAGDWFTNLICYLEFHGLISCVRQGEYIFWAFGKGAEPAVESRERVRGADEGLDSDLGEPEEAFGDG